MNLKDKAFLEKYRVKETNILIGLDNFGTTNFSIRIGRLPVQTPLDSWPNLGTQHRYKAFGDHQIEILIKHSD